MQGHLKLIKLPVTDISPAEGTCQLLPFIPAEVFLCDENQTHDRVVEVLQAETFSSCASLFSALPGKV